MKAWIIAIGDELLSGYVINSNSAYISKKLNEIGIEVFGSSVIPDNIDRISSEIKYAMNYSDLLIICGGLGPTGDDLTREGVAKALNKKLIFNQNALEMVKNSFKRLGREAPEESYVEANLPENSIPIENKVGTAPGFWIKLDNNKAILVLPGPPNEMENILISAGLEYIKSLEIKNYILTELIRTTGITEIEISRKLKEIPQDDSVIIAYQPRITGVDLRLTAKAKTKMDCKYLIEKTKNEIQNILDEYIYATGEKELSEVIGEILIEKNQTISTAESCTGGLIAKTFTDISGSSKYFSGSAVTYSNESKIDVLGVKKENILKYGAVSEIVAKEMAEGAKKIFKSSWGLSTTGIAGPTGGTDEKPVGTVFIGLSGNKTTKVFKYNFHGNRERIRLKTTYEALSILRKTLLDKI